MLDSKREDAGMKHLNNSKEFIECSNMMDDIYENINVTIQSEKEKQ